MPLVEDSITGYLIARNYPAFCGVDAEIRVRRSRLNPTKVRKSDKARERGVYAVSAELSSPARAARSLCVAGGFGYTADHR